ncbi:ABC transporter permease [Clostridium sporogenes]|uniref:ABC transporter permease n=1 Tax=Clostridium sporogenes TaxID=1509 RepID=UPI0006B28BE9|nr:ABC transporter permease [Clostridium sporogenes]KOY65401.1 hypothetical protein AN649_13045 [Clostridium sporogenes]MDS1006670.1 ABC transporter permease [Clostridium sporogenes]
MHGLNKTKSIHVFKKEFAASFRFLPLIISGMITPLLIFAVFGMGVGKYVPSYRGFTFSQLIISGILLFQLTCSTFYQVSYSTFFAANVTQTLDEFLTAPISSRDILLGRVLNNAVIGLITAIPVSVVLILISNIKVSVLYYLVSLIYLMLIGILFSSLGALLGITVDVEFSLINFANAIIIPLNFISDTFIRISDKNILLNYILYLSPIKLANDGMRKALLFREFDIISLIALIIYTAVVYVISAKIFEKKSLE